MPSVREIRRMSDTRSNRRTLRRFVSNCDDRELRGDPECKAAQDKLNQWNAHSGGGPVGGGGGGTGRAGGSAIGRGAIPFPSFDTPFIRHQKNLMVQQFKTIDRMEEQFLSLDAVTLQYNNSTGQMIGHMGQQIGLAYDAEEAFGKYGSVTERMSKQLRGVISDQAEHVKSQMALAAGYSRLSMEESKYETSMGSAMAIMNKMGISNEEQAEMMDIMARSHDLGAQKIMDNQMEMLSMSTALGVSNQKMASDFRNAQSMMAYDATKTMEVFKGMQAVSKSTGIAQGELNQTFGQSMDTFDGAASVAGRLNAALGTQINATELLRADEHERMMIIKQAFEDSGRSVDDLQGRTGKFFRDMLGDAMGGMSRENVGRFFRMNMDEYKIHMDRMQVAADKFQPYGTKGNIEQQVEVLAAAYQKRMGTLTRAQEGVKGVLDARIERTFDSIDSMTAGQNEVFRGVVRTMDQIDKGMSDTAAKVIGLSTAYGPGGAAILGMTSYTQHITSLSRTMEQVPRSIAESITGPNGLGAVIRVGGSQVEGALGGLVRTINNAAAAISNKRPTQSTFTDVPWAYDGAARSRYELGLHTFDRSGPTMQGRQRLLPGLRIPP